jgi:hypothetical protein
MIQRHLVTDGIDRCGSGSIEVRQHHCATPVLRGRSIVLALAAPVPRLA